MNVPANEPWLQFMARVASLSIPLPYYPNKIHTLNRFWNLISHCSTRIIYNKLAQITSIWYETLQPVALSQGRHHTYTRHSKTPHSVVNAVECSRQRPVIATRTVRTETAGMQAVAAALLPSTTRSECGCTADWSRISITTHLTMGEAHF
jgi:hypothetical protein